MAFYRCGSGGGTTLKGAWGQLIISTETGTTYPVTCGFRPIALYYSVGTSYTTRNLMRMYDSRLSTTKWYGAGSSGLVSADIGDNSNASGSAVYSITDNGFVIDRSKDSRYTYCNWFAIGE